jgi:hypothetical protein
VLVVNEVINVMAAYQAVVQVCGTQRKISYVWKGNLTLNLCLEIDRSGGGEQMMVSR